MQKYPLTRCYHLNHSLFSLLLSALIFLRGRWLLLSSARYRQSISTSSLNPPLPSYSHQPYCQYSICCPHEYIDVSRVLFQWYLYECIGIVYLLVAAISLFSPLSGFLADVCFSRYTVILVCFCLHFAAFLVYTVAGVFTLTLGSGIWDISHYDGGGIALCLLIFALIAFIVFVFDFAGYRANIIQFRLDQLLEAPSSCISSTLHTLGHLG